MKAIFRVVLVILFRSAVVSGAVSSLCPGRVMSVNLLSHAAGGAI
jgi:hypothetical protein